MGGLTSSRPPRPFQRTAMRDDDLLAYPLPIDRAETSSDSAHHKHTSITLVKIEKVSSHAAVMCVVSRQTFSKGKLLCQLAHLVDRTLRSHHFQSVMCSALNIRTALGLLDSSSWQILIVLNVFQRKFYIRALACVH